MDTRLALVVFPPRMEVAAVEEFRRTHDPLFHKVAAHIALVRPFAGHSPDRALERFRSVLETREQDSFAVGLGGAGRYDDGVVFMRVGEGAGTLTRLHDALGRAVEPAPGLPPRPFVPHCTVGRASGGAEAAFLERQAAGRLEPLHFRVEALSLLVEDARGLWLEHGRLSLLGRPSPV